jgi:CBS domain-containing protein
MEIQMTRDQAFYFREQFRNARLEALRDAEAFDGIIHVLERMGSFLHSGEGSLEKFKEVMNLLAAYSPLAHEPEQEGRPVQVSFSRLYDLLRWGRNDAMHQGAVARHLTSTAIKVAVVLEDALVNLATSQPDVHCSEPKTNKPTMPPPRVFEFMSRNPVCAEVWQPLSFIRQVMLESSFSHLPVNLGTPDIPKWKLVVDEHLAKYLRPANQTEREKRLRQPLSDAVEATASIAFDAETCLESDPVSSVVAHEKRWPVLVLNDRKELVGILTAYDLL